MTNLPMSVIIITLNEEKTISRLMEDLKQQTNKNFEVIVVDSNSDDNTVTLAREHGEDFILSTVKCFSFSLANNQNDQKPSSQFTSLNDKALYAVGQ